VSDNNVLAQQHLLCVSKVQDLDFRRIVLENGVLNVSRKEPRELLTFLVKTVIGQQLSTSAARSIWLRVERLAVEKRCNLIQLLCDDNLDCLRQCGLSNNKVKATLEINSVLGSESGFAETLLNSNYPDVVNKIESIWGLGRWSADMCAMFYCGLQDVLPINDSAINKGVKKLFGTADVEYVTEKYAPFRTYMCLHIWRAIDGNYL